MFGDNTNNLNLETTGATTSTGLLEFASLGAHIGLDIGVGVEIVDRCAVSKVGKSLAILGAAEEHGVGTLGRTKGELVKSETLATRRKDALPRVLREGQGTDRHLGALHHAHIVGHLAHNDSSFPFLVRHEFRETMKPDRRRVDL